MPKYHEYVNVCTFVEPTLLSEKRDSHQEVFSMLYVIKTAQPGLPATELCLLAFLKRQHLNQGLNVEKDSAQRSAERTFPTEENS